MLIAQRLEIGSVPVIATFECNGSIQRIDNQDEDSCVDDLMDTIGYAVDIHQYPELKNISGKTKCIQYHAEKKALAHLWNQNVMKIDISVNLRMCRDCHSFFKAFTKYYSDRSVCCTDPRTRHIFENGQCSCGS